jgi:hypothetical protein
LPQSQKFDSRSVASGGGLVGSIFQISQSDERYIFTSKRCRISHMDRQ